MSRNALKIVCNPYAKNLAYYFRNECGEWQVLSESSELSRQFFTRATMRERACDIIEKADEIYNRKNRGLDIIFEGTSESFDYLKKAVEKYKVRDISCKVGTSRIVVIGKRRVGKTTLINSIFNLLGCEAIQNEFHGVEMYSDATNNIQWYELKGMDVGQGELEGKIAEISNLCEEGVSKFVYCISGCNGRVEDAEKRFLEKMAMNFPELTGMIVLTMCYKEDSYKAADEIEKISGNYKVIQTLAQEYVAANRKNSQSVRIEPFGLDILTKYIFEER